MSVLSDLRNALTLMTALPAGTAPEPPGPGTVAFFPWIGMLLGGIAAGLLALVNWGSWTYGRGFVESGTGLVLGVLVVSGWAGATRLFHWDGLADVGDALWGGHTPERRLEIMSDSATGAFGASAIVFVAVAQVAAIGAIMGSGGSVAYVFAAPVFGRLAPLFAAWLGKPARLSGLGRSIMGSPDYGSLMVGVIAASLATGVLAAFTGLPGVVLAAEGLIIAAVIPHLLSKPMGGVTGDVMGASVLLTEVVFLVTAALVVGF